MLGHRGRPYAHLKGKFDKVGSCVMGIRITFASVLFPLVLILPARSSGLLTPAGLAARPTKQVLPATYESGQQEDAGGADIRHARVATADVEQRNDEKVGTEKA